MQAVILSAQLILVLLVGLVAQKLKIIGPEFNKQISAFVMKIALPCMVVDSMNVPNAFGRLIDNFWILILSACVLLVSFLIGLVVSKLLKNQLPERILRFGATFSNFNFFGLVVVERLGGEDLVFYYLLFIIPVRLSIYLLAKAILVPKDSKHGKSTMREKIKAVVSPPLVAVFVALGLSALEIQVPVVLQYALDELGGLAAPLGILVCGSTLGCYPVKQMITGRSIGMSCVRNILIPFVIFGLCTLLKLPEMYKQMAVIYASLPVASLTSTYVLQYDPDPRAHLDGSGFVFVSTLMASVSMTLFVSLL